MLKIQPSAPVRVQGLVHSKLFPALHGLAAVVIEEVEDFPLKNIWPFQIPKDYVIFLTFLGYYNQLLMTNYWFQNVIG